MSFRLAVPGAAARDRCAVHCGQTADETAAFRMYYGSIEADAYPPLGAGGADFLRGNDLFTLSPAAGREYRLAPQGLDFLLFYDLDLLPASRGCRFAPQGLVSFTLLRFRFTPRKPGVPVPSGGPIFSTRRKWGKRRVKGAAAPLITPEGIKFPLRSAGAQRA